MATWISNGADVGGSGGYVAGTQSVQYCHDNFVSTGDTIIVPNGTFSWSTGVSLTAAMTLQGQTTGSVHIQNQLTSGYGLLMTSGTAGHIYLTGINFIQIADNSGGAGFLVACDRNTSTSFTVIVTNCVFDSGFISIMECFLKITALWSAGARFKHRFFSQMESLITN